MLDPYYLQLSTTCQPPALSVRGWFAFCMKITGERIGETVMDENIWHDYIQEFNQRVREALIDRSIEPARRVETRVFSEYVYVLRAENGLYKIGRSKNPDSRINGIRTSSPVEIEVVHVIPTDNMALLEAKLHQSFAHLRKIGEWFALNPSDVEYIKALQS